MHAHQRGGNWKLTLAFFPLLHFFLLMKHEMFMVIIFTFFHSTDRENMFWLSALCQWLMIVFLSTPASCSSKSLPFPSRLDFYCWFSMSCQKKNFRLQKCLFFPYKNTPAIGHELPNIKSHDFFVFIILFSHFAS